MLNLLCILAITLNLGVAIYCKRNYDKQMKEWRDLGRMEGFIEGVRSATEGNAKIKDNVIVLN